MNQYTYFPLLQHRNFNRKTTRGFINCLSVCILLNSCSGAELNESVRFCPINTYCGIDDTDSISISSSGSIISDSLSGTFPVLPKSSSPQWRYISPSALQTTTGSPRILFRPPASLAESVTFHDNRIEWLYYSTTSYNYRHSIREYYPIILTNDTNTQFSFLSRIPFNHYNNASLVPTLSLYLSLPSSTSTTVPKQFTFPYFRTINDIINGIQEKEIDWNGYIFMLQIYPYSNTVEYVFIYCRTYHCTTIQRINHNQNNNLFNNNPFYYTSDNSNTVAPIYRKSFQSFDKYPQRDKLLQILVNLNISMVEIYLSNGSLGSWNLHPTFPNINNGSNPSCLVQPWIEVNNSYGFIESTHELIRTGNNTSNYMDSLTVVNTQVSMNCPHLQSLSIEWFSLSGTPGTVNSSSPKDNRVQHYPFRIFLYNQQGIVCSLPSIILEDALRYWLQPINVFDRIIFYKCNVTTTFPYTDSSNEGYSNYCGILQSTNSTTNNSLIGIRIGNKQHIRYTNNQNTFQSAFYPRKISIITNTVETDTEQDCTLFQDNAVFIPFRSTYTAGSTITLRIYWNNFNRLHQNLFNMYGAVILLINNQYYRTIPNITTIVIDDSVETCGISFHLVTTVPLPSLTYACTIDVLFIYNDQPIMSIETANVTYIHLGTLIIEPEPTVSRDYTFISPCSSNIWKVNDNLTFAIHMRDQYNNPVTGIRNIITTTTHEQWDMMLYNFSSYKLYGNSFGINLYNLKYNPLILPHDSVISVDIPLTQYELRPDRYIVSVIMNGKHVRCSPLSIDIVPRPVNTAKSTAYLYTNRNYAYAGIPWILRLMLRDRFNYPVPIMLSDLDWIKIDSSWIRITVNLANQSVYIDLFIPLTCTSIIRISKMALNENKDMVIRFLSTCTGLYSLNVSINDVPLTLHNMIPVHDCETFPSIDALRVLNTSTNNVNDHRFTLCSASPLWPSKTILFIDLFNNSLDFAYNTSLVSVPPAISLSNRVTNDGKYFWRSISLTASMDNVPILYKDTNTIINPTLIISRSGNIIGGIPCVLHGLIIQIHNNISVTSLSVHWRIYQSPATANVTWTFSPFYPNGTSILYYNLTEALTLWTLEYFICNSSSAEEIKDTRSNVSVVSSVPYTGVCSSSLNKLSMIIDGNIAGQLQRPLANITTIGYNYTLLYLNISMIDTAITNITCTIHNFDPPTAVSDVSNPRCVVTYTGTVAIYVIYYECRSIICTHGEYQMNIFQGDTLLESDTFYVSEPLFNEFLVNTSSSLSVPSYNGSGYSLQYMSIDNYLGSIPAGSNFTLRLKLYDSYHAMVIHPVMVQIRLYYSGNTTYPVLTLNVTLNQTLSYSSMGEYNWLAASMNGIAIAKAGVYQINTFWIENGAVIELPIRYPMNASTSLSIPQQTNELFVEPRDPNTMFIEDSTASNESFITLDMIKLFRVYVTDQYNNIFSGNQLHLLNGRWNISFVPVNTNVNNNTDTIICDTFPTIGSLSGSVQIQCPIQQIYSVGSYSLQIEFSYSTGTAPLYAETMIELTERLPHPATSFVTFPSATNRNISIHSNASISLEEGLNYPICRTFSGSSPVPIYANDDIEIGLREFRGNPLSIIPRYQICFQKVNTVILTVDDINTMYCIPLQSSSINHNSNIRLSLNFPIVKLFETYCLRLLPLVLNQSTEYIDYGGLLSTHPLLTVYKFPVPFYPSVIQIIPLPVQENIIGILQLGFDSGENSRIFPNGVIHNIAFLNGNPDYKDIRNFEVLDDDLHQFYLKIRFTSNSSLVRAQDFYRINTDIDGKTVNNIPLTVQGRVFLGLWIYNLPKIFIFPITDEIIMNRTTVYREILTLSILPSMLRNFTSLSYGTGTVIACTDYRNRTTNTFDYNYTFQWSMITEALQNNRSFGTCNELIGSRNYSIVWGSPTSTDSLNSALWNVTIGNFTPGTVNNLQQLQIPLSNYPVLIYPERGLNITLTDTKSSWDYNYPLPTLLPNSMNINFPILGVSVNCLKPSTTIFSNNIYDTTDSVYTQYELNDEDAWLWAETVTIDSTRNANVFSTVVRTASSGFFLNGCTVGSSANFSIQLFPSPLAWTQSYYNDTYNPMMVSLYTTTIKLPTDTHRQNDWSGSTSLVMMNLPRDSPWDTSSSNSISSVVPPSNFKAFSMIQLVDPYGDPIKKSMNPRTITANAPNSLPKLSIHSFSCSGRYVTGTPIGITVPYIYRMSRNFTSDNIMIQPTQTNGIEYFFGTDFNEGTSSDHELYRDYSNIFDSTPDTTMINHAPWCNWTLYALHAEEGLLPHITTNIYDLTISSPKIDLPPFPVYEAIEMNYNFNGRLQSYGALGFDSSIIDTVNMDYLGSSIHILLMDAFGNVAYDSTPEYSLAYFTLPSVLRYDFCVVITSLNNPNDSLLRPAFVEHVTDKQEILPQDFLETYYVGGYGLSSLPANFYHLHISLVTSIQSSILKSSYIPQCDPLQEKTIPGSPFKIYIGPIGTVLAVDSIGQSCTGWTIDTSLPRLGDELSIMFHLCTNTGLRATVSIVPVDSLGLYLSGPNYVVSRQAWKLQPIRLQTMDYNNGSYTLTIIPRHTGNATLCLYATNRIVTCIQPIIYPGRYSPTHSQIIAPLGYRLPDIHQHILFPQHDQLSIIAGKDGILTVYFRDLFGNSPLIYHSLSSYKNIALGINISFPPIAILGNTTDPLPYYHPISRHDPVPCTISVENTLILPNAIDSWHHRNITYRCTSAGIYTVGVYDIATSNVLQGIYTWITGNPWKLQVLPGPIAPYRSTIHGSRIITIGSCNIYYIRLRDAYGNSGGTKTGYEYHNQRLMVVWIPTNDNQSTTVNISSLRDLETLSILAWRSTNSFRNSKWNSLSGKDTLRIRACAFDSRLQTGKKYWLRPILFYSDYESNTTDTFDLSPIERTDDKSTNTSGYSTRFEVLIESSIPRSTYSSLWNSTNNQVGVINATNYSSWFATLVLKDQFNSSCTNVTKALEWKYRSPVVQQPWIRGIAVHSISGTMVPLVFRSNTEKYTVPCTSNVSFSTSTIIHEEFWWEGFLELFIYIGKGSLSASQSVDLCIRENECINTSQYYIQVLNNYGNNNNSGSLPWNNRTLWNPSNSSISTALSCAENSILYYCAKINRSSDALLPTLWPVNTAFDFQVQVRNYEGNTLSFAYVRQLYPVLQMRMYINRTVVMLLCPYIPLDQQYHCLIPSTVFVPRSNVSIDLYLPSEYVGTTQNPPSDILTTLNLYIIELDSRLEDIYNESLLSYSLLSDYRWLPLSFPLYLQSKLFSIDDAQSTFFNFHWNNSLSLYRTFLIHHQFYSIRINTDTTQVIIAIPINPSSLTIISSIISTAYTSNIYMYIPRSMENHHLTFEIRNRSSLLHNLTRPVLLPPCRWLNLQATQSNEYTVYGSADESLTVPIFPVLSQQPCRWYVEANRSFVTTMNVSYPLDQTTPVADNNIEHCILLFPDYWYKTILCPSLTTGGDNYRLIALPNYAINITFFNIDAGLSEIVQTNFQLTSIEKLSFLKDQRLPVSSTYTHRIHWQSLLRHIPYNQYLTLPNYTVPNSMYLQQSSMTKTGIIVIYSSATIPVNLTNPLNILFVSIHRNTSYMIQVYDKYGNRCTACRDEIRIRINNTTITAAYQYQGLYIFGIDSTFIGSHTATVLYSSYWNVSLSVSVRIENLPRRVIPGTLSLSRTVNPSYTWINPLTNQIDCEAGYLCTVQFLFSHPVMQTSLLDQVYFQATLVNVNVTGIPPYLYDAPGIIILPTPQPYGPMLRYISSIFYIEVNVSATVAGYYKLYVYGDGEMLLTETVWVNIYGSIPDVSRSLVYGAMGNILYQHSNVYNRIMLYLKDGYGNNVQRLPYGTYSNLILQSNDELRIPIIRAYFSMHTLPMYPFLWYSNFSIPVSFSGSSTVTYRIFIEFYNARNEITFCLNGSQTVKIIDAEALPYGGTFAKELMQLQMENSESRNSESRILFSFPRWMAYNYPVLPSVQSWYTTDIFPWIAVPSTNNNSTGKLIPRFMILTNTTVLSLIQIPKPFDTVNDNSIMVRFNQDVQPYLCGNIQIASHPHGWIRNGTDTNVTNVTMGDHLFINGDICIHPFDPSVTSIDGIPNRIESWIKQSLQISVTYKIYAVGTNKLYRYETILLPLVRQYWYPNPLNNVYGTVTYGWRPLVHPFWYDDQQEDKYTKVNIQFYSFGKLYLSKEFLTRFLHSSSMHSTIIEKVWYTTYSTDTQGSATVENNNNKNMHLIPSVIMQPYSLPDLTDNIICPSFAPVKCNTDGSCRLALIDCPQVPTTIHRNGSWPVCYPAKPWICGSARLYRSFQCVNSYEECDKLYSTYTTVWVSPSNDDNYTTNFNIHENSTRNSDPSLYNSTIILCPLIHNLTEPLQLSTVKNYHDRCSIRSFDTGTWCYDGITCFANISLSHHCSPPQVSLRGLLSLADGGDRSIIDTNQYLDTLVQSTIGNYFDIYHQTFLYTTALLSVLLGFTCLWFSGTVVTLYARKNIDVIELIEQRTPNQMDISPEEIKDYYSYPVIHKPHFRVRTLIIPTIPKTKITTAREGNPEIFLFESLITTSTPDPDSRTIVDIENRGSRHII